jgi:hypothetical protein
MKTYIALISLLLIMIWSTAAQAQVDPTISDFVIVIIDDSDSEDGNDSTELKIGNIRIVIGDDSRITVRAVHSFFRNTLISGGNYSKYG